MLDTQVSKFLQELTYGSSFEFLDIGKNKTELEEIAKQANLKLPSHDLSIFKCVYAFVDRQNLNKCTLPREEVEKALPTLNGKAIDFDHFRKRVVGHWLEGKLDGNQIIAYGVFYKSNFSEDFETIKGLFENGNLAISFEAWGDRIPNKTGYDLHDIEFAGGALLLKESPAFPGSEVMEMAKTRVLEFAKVMTPPKSFLHGKKMEWATEAKFEELPEVARFYLFDAQIIAQLMSEADCSVCNQKGYMDMKIMDYENNIGKVQCINCGTDMRIYFTPRTEQARQVKEIKAQAEVALHENIVDYINQSIDSDEVLEMIVAKEIEDSPEKSTKLSYQDRQKIDDDMFAVIVTSKNKITGEPRKIRMFPIHDPANASNSLDRLSLSKVNETLQKLGVSIDSVSRKILKRARELNMKKLMEQYKKGSVDELIQMYSMELAKRELTAEELEKAFSLVDLKAKKGTANPTSLQAVDGGGGKPTATSLQTASITEEELKEIVKEVAGVKPEPPKETAKEQKPDETKPDELATLKATVEKMQAEMAQMIEKNKALEAETATLRSEKEAIEKAKKDELIKSRKDELGDFAKEMTDEDVMDDNKFEIAKLKKENAELKAGKKVEEKPPLTKGSADKGKSAEVLEREKVNKIAFPNLGAKK